MCRFSGKWLSSERNDVNKISYSSWATYGMGYCRMWWAQDRRSMENKFFYSNWQVNTYNTSTCLQFIILVSPSAHSIYIVMQYANDFSFDFWKWLRTGERLWNHRSQIREILNQFIQMKRFKITASRLAIQMFAKQIVVCTAKRENLSLCNSVILTAMSDC